MKAVLGGKFIILIATIKKETENKEKEKEKKKKPHQ